MDWVDRPKNYKGLYGILQLLQGCHLDNFSLKTLKLGWVAFHPRTFQLKCLDFQSNQYKKLAPVLSRFCNGLWRTKCHKEPESEARLHADVSENRLPPEKRDFRSSKNNFRGHDISQPSIRASLSVPSFSLDNIPQICSTLECSLF